MSSVRRYRLGISCPAGYCDVLDVDMSREVRARSLRYVQDASVRLNRPRLPVQTVSFRGGNHWEGRGGMRIQW